MKKLIRILKRDENFLTDLVLVCAIPLLALVGCGTSHSHSSPNINPAIISFQVSSSSLGTGDSAFLTAVFAGGSAVIDNIPGPITSGVPVSTGALAKSTIFTLTVTSSTGASQTASLEIFIGSFRVLAGNSSGMGSVDGPRALAQFHFPGAIAPDQDGNLFVADAGNSTIRKVSAAGVVSTFAGLPGHFGTIDGVGADARFEAPAGLVCDAAGTLIVVDSNSSTIRKISPSGIVTTIAGAAEQSGAVDGPGLIARFSSPHGVVLDSAGNIFVADTGNNTIRKISTSGLVSTWAGQAGLPGIQDGALISARFNAPMGLAIGPAGELFVVDSGNCTIRMISPGGMVTTFAGQPGIQGNLDGAGSVAQFDYPQGLAIDSKGNLWVADSSNNCIRMVTPLGVVSTIAGSSGQSGSTDGPGASARFLSPIGVAISLNGDAIVGDSGNNTLRLVSSTGQVSTWAGSVEVLGSADGLGSIATFSRPGGIALFGTSGYLVVDTLSSSIRTISETGMVATLAGFPGPGYQDGPLSVAQFNSPQGIVEDSSGNIFIADTGNHAIRVISAEGIVKTLAGNGHPGLADGPGQAAQFNYPTGLAMDPNGLIYVADSQNHSIRKITSQGLVSTLAGLPGQLGTADGSGLSARFNDPEGVACDAVGNIYVADTVNCLIRIISPSGEVRTVAGVPMEWGWADGRGASAQFSFPNSLTVDGLGNAFVSDGDSTIRYVTQDGDVLTVIGKPFMSGTLAGDFPGFIAKPTGIVLNPGTGHLLITVPDAVLEVSY